MNLNLKMVGECASGGDHVSIDFTPGPTVSVSVSMAKDYTQQFADMSNAEKACVLIALHANVNNITLAQARDDAQSVSGIDFVI